jgi:Putative carbonic anhydrase
MGEGKFGTAINCMDGRVQEPVINWMKVRYGLDYVDMINPDLSGS